MRSQLVAFVTATSLTGCSFAFTRGPKSEPNAAAPVLAQPDCTHSMAWPAVDGIIAAVALLAVAGALQDSNDDSKTDEQRDDAGGSVAAGIVVAGVAGAGALIGYSRVNKCRRANELYAASYQQSMGQGYPQPYAYPQAYPAQPQYQYPQPQPYGQQPVYTPVYPAPQPVAQPAPVQPMPAPAPAPAPVKAKPAPRPVAPKPAPAPPAPPPAELGTEGDVCTTQAECSTGFACTGNVCLKKK
ncbi:MAG: hypothetical protein ABI867_12820 [Kofleriaceae bacterium]